MGHRPRIPQKQGADRSCRFVVVGCRNEEASPFATVSIAVEYGSICITSTFGARPACWWCAKDAGHAGLVRMERVVYLRVYAASNYNRKLSNKLRCVHCVTDPFSQETKLLPSQRMLDNVVIMEPVTTYVAAARSYVRGYELLQSCNNVAQATVATSGSGTQIPLCPTASSEWQT